MASSMFNLSGALSDPQASSVPYWDMGQNYLNLIGKQWRKSFGEQNDLWNQASAGIQGNTQQAIANAGIYNDYIKNLFQKPVDGFGQYQQVGDYLYGKLNNYTDLLKDAGMKDMNLRLANQGITPGTTGYDRLLNATRITSNMLPAFNNTTNAIGRDYNTISNDAYRQMLTRLGLAQSDALTANIDRPYTRLLDLANERQDQHLGRANMLNQLIGAARNNTAGWQVKEGSDWAKAIGVVDNLLNGAVDIYGSMYGGGMGGGMGMGGGGGIGGYNSPALGGQGGGGMGFNWGNSAQLGNAAGGSQNMGGIIQLLMGMMNRPQPQATGTIPGGSVSGFDSEAGLGYY